MERPRVVIVGAGFAGLYAAKKLKRVPVEVLLIDQNNYHTFQPLLYQVATAMLEPEEIAHSIRGAFHGQRNIDFYKGTVSGVNWEDKTVHITDQEFSYDYLILATGAIYNDFGVKGVREYGFFLKSLTEAVNIRGHILEQFEQADANPSLIDEGILNFVVVGGGPTGIEMVGALYELFDRVLPKDFTKLDVSKAKIILVEQISHLLDAYSNGTRDYALRALQKHGIEIHLNTAVTEVRKDAIVLVNDQEIPTRTTLWAAGVRAHPLVEALDVELTRGYRIKVNPDLSIPNNPNAFVIGDMAGALDKEGELLPQVCPVAIQEGNYVAKQIQQELLGKPRKDFKYLNKGSMAIVGRNVGIAELSKKLGGFKLHGFLGWGAWLFIHIIYLIGFQNRFQVLSQWAYSYLTFDRKARLITEMTPSEIEKVNRIGKINSSKNHD